MGGRVKLGIELRIPCSDTMLNYWLSQKLKLLGNGEFNHLTISLTNIMEKKNTTTKSVRKFSIKVTIWWQAKQMDYNNHDKIYS